MTTWQKATALVPLALLSGAWTASLAVSRATAADSEDAQKLPDGSTDADRGRRGARQHLRSRRGRPRRARRAARTRSSRAPRPTASPRRRCPPTSAPRRSSTTADASCNIEWPLVAAIGRVESDHGRYGGNVLTAEGVSQPGHLRHPAGRLQRHPADHRHRRRPVRQRQDLRPRGRPDAVHPLDLVGRGRGRRRRRQAQPAGHRRRGAGDRRLPLLRRRGPLHARRPGVRGLPLQPQRRLREPRPVDHGRLRLAATTARCPNNSIGHHDLHPVVRRLGLQRRHPGLHSRRRRPSNGGTGGELRRRQRRRPGPGGTGGSTGEHPADEPDPTAARRPTAPTGTAPTRGKTVEDTVKDVEDDVKDGVDGTVKDPGGTVEDTVTEAEATAECLAQGLPRRDACDFNACVADLLG